MLGMVKKEMQIVNEADSDRDQIESYLAQLQILQKKKATMINTLQAALVDLRKSQSDLKSVEKKVTSRRNSFSRYLSSAVGDESDFEEDLR